MMRWSGSRPLAVRLTGGRVLTARRILVATGVHDQLPDIPGVRERWGRDLLHCPYCHGWEVRDQPVGVLGTHPGAVDHAQLVRQWSDDVVFFAHTNDLTPTDVTARRTRTATIRSPHAGADCSRRRAPTGFGVVPSRRSIADISDQTLSIVPGRDHRRGLDHQSARPCVRARVGGERRHAGSSRPDREGSSSRSAHTPHPRRQCRFAPADRTCRRT